MSKQVASRPRLMRLGSAKTLTRAVVELGQRESMISQNYWP
jgi:hypothetical protein